MEWQTPYYAVIFSSRKQAAAVEDYEAMAAEMVALAAEQQGYLGHESYRNADGDGITVSYWQTEEDIRAWKNHTRHLLAQQKGRRDWYEHYTVRVARVERTYTGGVF